MKSLEELKAIREKALQNVGQRMDNDNVRVVVGMATCGIAAGARPVMLAFVEEAKERGITNVAVSQTGCIGMCRYEPIVDVILPDKEKVTYINVDPDMVKRIFTEHIINGNPVQEYTVGAAAKN